LTVFVLDCGRTQHAADLLILALVNSTKFSLLEAIGTFQVQLSNRPLFQTLLGFSFQNSSGDGLIGIMAFTIVLGKFVLLRVDA